MTRPGSSSNSYTLVRHDAKNNRKKNLIYSPLYFLNFKMSFLLLKQRKEKKKREAKKKVYQIWFTFFLLNKRLLMIFFMVKF